MSDFTRVFELSGGLTSEPMHATKGEHTWQRADGETLAAFRERVIASAKGVAGDLLVIGGLPD